MKSYTDIEQSKKLAEILPIESADMTHRWFGKDWYEVAFGRNTFGRTCINGDDIPCWSLAALLDILHDYTLQTNSDGSVFVVCDSKKPMISDSYRNPVDACVDMILELKERDLL